MVLDIQGYISPSQAANLAGVSASAVRDWADAGRIRSVRTALGRLVLREDVERIRVERGGKRSGR